jgi:hypothetical protein
MRTKLLALLAALLVCVVGGPLQAANLLINGDFEDLDMRRATPDHSTLIGDGVNALPVATGWTTTGYNFIFTDNPNYLSGPPPGGLRQTLTGADDYFDPAYVDANGSYGFRLWGPDNFANPTNNGLTGSPTGGSFLGADGAFLNAPIQQTLTGLEIGRTYSVSFWWAAGQQSIDSGGFDGITQEHWTICFGVCSFTSDFTPNGDGYSTFTPGMMADPNDPMNMIADSQYFTTDTVTTPNHGFIPWQHEYTTFTATSTTQTLSLLAYGTPLGQPPFALIDGLELQAVPEPTTWAMMLIGFGVIGGVMRTRRQSFNGRRALNSQII